MQRQPTHIDVIGKTHELSNAIRELSKEIDKPTNQNEKRQEVLRNTLKVKVEMLGELTMRGINSKTIAGDSTGILTKSVFTHPWVHELASEWQAKQNPEEINDARGTSVATGEDGGTYNKATIEHNKGTIIVNKKENLITYIWRGIVRTVEWIKDKAISFVQFMINLANSIWGWFVSLFKGKGDNVVSMEAERNRRAMIKEAEELAPLAKAA